MDSRMALQSLCIPQFFSLVRQMQDVESQIPVFPVRKLLGHMHEIDGDFLRWRRLEFSRFRSGCLKLVQPVSLMVETEQKWRKIQIRTMGRFQTMREGVVGGDGENERCLLFNYFVQVDGLEKDGSGEEIVVSIG